jgi:3-methyladenine DNA glycosylase AlkC
MGASPRRVVDLLPERLTALQAGDTESRTLTECLAIDLAGFAARALPDFGPDAVRHLASAAELGITRRMALAGKLCLGRYGPAGLGPLVAHPADTARGFACFAIGAQPDISLAAALEAIRPLADDPHFGVREWAWLALRPRIAAEIEAAIALLAPWTGEASPRLRRFASEATRPRGVWCPHIGPLRQAPWLGLPILLPLRGDAERYVQDSVANWLNDAAKDQPGWVRGLIAEWRADPTQPAAPRLARAALRSCDKTPLKPPAAPR